MQNYQHILDVEKYVLERRQQVEMFVEMVKIRSGRCGSSARNKLKKSEIFSLTKHQQKTKAKMLAKKSQDQLGAFYNLVEERQQLEGIL